MRLTRWVLFLEGCQSVQGGFESPRGGPEEEEQSADDHQKPWCNGEFEKEAREEKSEKQDLNMVEAEQFAEEAIDALRRQKRDELVKLRKAAEFEAKMKEAEGTAAVM